uniref:Coenzyme Q-binding protein COQ10 START domain-containing protein n=1 Tax=Panagrolaimus davidi TaxID=227884 RepID=A0A914P4E8_9BILA
MRFCRGLLCVTKIYHNSAIRYNNVYNITAKRQLFGFGQGTREQRVMEYAEKRLIGFTAEQMFDVVNNVSAYPQFVPYCKKAEVRKVSDYVLEAELQIGFPPLHERYGSKVTALKPYVIRSVCTEGRLFHILDTTWRFQPLPDNPKCCTLYYSVEFEFRSLIHARLAHMFFDQVVRTMVKAFLKRAETLYGSPAIGYENMQPEVLAYKG